MSPPVPSSQQEKAALLGLWSIPGLGPKALDSVRAQVPNLVDLLDVRPVEWAVELGLPKAVVLLVKDAPPIRAIAERVYEDCERGDMGIAFVGDAAYPERLAEVEDGPPLLFYRGTLSAPRRRVAMVGSRRPENGAAVKVAAFAERVAKPGVCIVSGAAYGVDQACHHGAVKAGEVTWAFLGSALDEMDPGQAALSASILDRGGVFFSELPPGVRASQQTFPRRNRLISGAADAVLVVRAEERSGTLHTAQAAVRQRRPLLAMVGDPDLPTFKGCHLLIKKGYARLCDSPEDVWEAVGLQVERAATPQAPGRQVDWERLSPKTKQTYELLHRGPRVSFDDLLARSGIDAAALTCALVELELLGLAVQHPGKQYERV